LLPTGQLIVLNPRAASPTCDLPHCTPPVILIAIINERVQAVRRLIPVIRAAAAAYAWRATAPLALTLTLTRHQVGALLQKRACTCQDKHRWTRLLPNMNLAPFEGAGTVCCWNIRKSDPTLLDGGKINPPKCRANLRICKSA
jgi:hypothetical protein